MAMLDPIHNPNDYLDLLGRLHIDTRQRLDLPLGWDTTSLFVDYSPREYPVHTLFHDYERTFQLELVNVYLYQASRAWPVIPPGYNAICTFRIFGDAAPVRDLPILLRFEHNPARIRVYAEPVNESITNKP
jgi:hypothetical protein